MTCCVALFLTVQICPAQEEVGPELLLLPPLTDENTNTPLNEQDLDVEASASYAPDRINGIPRTNGNQNPLTRNQRLVFGNTPDDIGSQLSEAREEIDSLFPRGPLTPLHDGFTRWNERLLDSTGLDLGFNYTTLYQRAAEGTGRRGAASDDMDFFGEWNLLGSEGGTPGFIAFSSEIRDRYSPIPPSQLGSNVGTALGTTVGFNSQDLALVQLYWEHGSIESGMRYRIGRMDPALIYDGGRYVSSNYAFLSPAFSDTLPMPVPEAGLGAAGAIYPTANTYVALGVHDANGVRTQAGFDTFFDTREYFTALEFGAFPSEADQVRGLWHVTLWHIDARKDAGKPSDHGIALTFEQELGADGNIVPFFRYAYADEGLNPMRQNLAIGIGFENVFGQNEDLIGLAFGRGMPSNRSLRDEFVFETFYRIVITPHTHITPDLSVIIDPANAPERNSVAILGLRLRTLF